MDVTLSTRRLRLRRQVANDIPALMRGLNDFEVTRFLTNVPYPYTLEDAQWWTARQKPAEPGNAHFAIELSDEPGMIGAVGIDSELGYWLDRRFHGRGIMTEASAALLDWHFAQLPDDVVHSGAHKGNTASLNVQCKLGFVEASSSMRFAKSHDREIEHVETTLTLPAYREARAGLGG